MKDLYRLRTIVLLGNCQITIIKKYMEAMAPSVKFLSFEMTRDVLECISNGEFDFSIFKECDLILSHDPSFSGLVEFEKDKNWLPLIQRAFPTIPIKPIPYIFFSGFHPDMCYVYANDPTTNKITLCAPHRPYMSSIAFYGWTKGLTVEETLSMYSRDTFKALKLDEYWSISTNFIKDQFIKSNLPYNGLVEKWSERGCWMHTINHPHNHVLKDVATLLLQREGIPIAYPLAEIDDRSLADGPQNPLYDFHINELPVNNPHISTDIELLRSTIEMEYAEYNNYNKSALHCNRTQLQPFKDFENYLTNRFSLNPYKKIPDYRFWKRAVASIPMNEVNPCINPKFSITKTDKIATAGSCLSQRLSNALKNNGYNFYVVEESEEGSFSARYGNVYTARQLKQLFDRAFGLYTPKESYWITPEKTYVDPFRPQMGKPYHTIEELEANRKAHLERVRHMFMTTNVFVVTLGLTELWSSKEDGAAFPIAPGIVAGRVNDTHEFTNTSVLENINDLQSFVTSLTAVNPNVRIVITVSPQPPIATYDDEHILVAATYTKSVLRAAVGEVCKNNINCQYFPSYEMIVGNHVRSSRFEEDLRSITKGGVDYVMSTFLNFFSDDGTLHNTIKVSVNRNNNMWSSMMNDAQVVCDEDKIEN